MPSGTALMRPILVATLLLMSGSCKQSQKASAVKDDKAPNAAATQANDPALLVAFSAKGTNVGMDAGFMHALFKQNLTAVQQQRVVVSGSSSGSIMAGIFGCWGMTQDSLNVMDAVLSLAIFNKSNIDLPLTSVLTGLVLGYGSRVAQPAGNLDGIINTVTHYQNAICKPTFPFVITAANQDIVNAVRSVPITADPLTTGLAIAGYKMPVPTYYFNIPFVGGNADLQVDLNTYSVSNIHFGGSTVLNSTPNLAAPTYSGRACTYFVDQSMFDALQQIPSNTRLCDLRLVSTVADMQLAIRASVSEPTYFAPIVEPHPELLVPATYEGNAIVPTFRVYNGGYAMTIVTQDLKRRFPQMYAIGTGRTPFSNTQAAVIQNWYRVPLNEAINRARYWLDAEIPWSLAEWDVIGADSPQGNVATGYARFSDCINSRLTYPHGCNVDRTTVVKPGSPTDYQGQDDVQVGRPMDAWIASQHGDAGSDAALPTGSAGSSGTLDATSTDPSGSTQSDGL